MKGDSIACMYFADNSCYIICYFAPAIIINFVNRCKIIEVARNALIWKS